ncbi:uncharacterized protein HD556DRAFT_1247864 [Suillus plorans]|uniref:Uncharacterized protein n=1 Tax=Suillus plorans TaxID=116603 RepID=A0A9P7ACX7_9AGAM|nr:uncharacterized protein HD556DRAFT_1247864 [Suillus plorans]KAG1786740.1 hypothetical protein HD556DRAFT_1247864 [Suillus plorans]
MPSSPIRAVADFLQKLANTDNVASEAPDDVSVSNTPSESTTTSDVELLVQQLNRASLSDVASTSPATSETRLNHAIISPIKQKRGGALNIQPRTHNEVLLLAALHEAESANAALKRRVIELQATNILNQLYCSQLRGQLANKEAKKQSKKKNGKLMSDGLPQLLSSDEFYERVVNHEKEQKRVADDKKTRREERERRSEALAIWKRLEDARKRENNEQRTRYREAVEIWNEEKSKAKLSK